MAVTCLNLRELYGDRFKVTYEESYAADRGDNARAEDPWLMILPCQNGHIGPYGDDELFASTNSRRSIPQKLTELGCCRTWQDADDGVSVIFNVVDFAKVARVMKPRRKRQVTEEERQRLAEMSARFSPLRKPPISESVSDGQFRTLATQRDSERVQAAAATSGARMPSASPVA